MRHVWLKAAAPSSHYVSAVQPVVAAAVAELGLGEGNPGSIPLKTMSKDEITWMVFRV